VPGYPDDSAHLLLWNVMRKGGDRPILIGDTVIITGACWRGCPNQGSSRGIANPRFDSLNLRVGDCESCNKKRGIPDTSTKLRHIRYLLGAANGSYQRANKLLKLLQLLAYRGRRER
jgi:hypothetical protein